VTATLLYRIAAALLLLFAAGHTFGFLTFRPSSPEGLAVYHSMSSVKFEFNGSSISYAKFYNGFGLTVTAYLLFSAFLAWHLGTLAAVQPQAIGSLSWAFALVQLACFALSVLYLFIVPVIFSGVVFASLAWAAWLLGHARA
jgi:hypothetical protein